MEQLLASGRIYLMVIVFFSSCFLGLISNVSLPTLAMRSVAITVIVGILSSLFIKYFVSVAKTTSYDELDQTSNAVPPKVDHTVSQNIE